ncbi:MAG: endo-1,4-beta-xylanase [Xanthobacteraceae bacterium]|nr:endo-1,4-beta-xylanase [Xanthobacteraceae bacterium]
MRTVTRRDAVAIISGSAVTMMSQNKSAAGSQSTLGAAAAGSGLMFGAAAGYEIDKDVGYRDLYTDEARIITTDTALKMGSIAPQPGAKHFESADRLLKFCATNRIPMRGHCVIWNEWVPQWVRSMSKSERQTFFDGYIEEVVGRYIGKLHSWDIVNEPFWPGHKAPGGYRLGPWYDAFGTDYIRRAFERANSVDKTTKFVLNEAQTERDDDVGLAVRAGILKLVRELKDGGVRLNAVGLQGHLQPKYPHDPQRFAEFVHELAGLGVDIYITEFDVRDDTFPDDIKARDEMVAKTAEQFLNTVLRIPAVKVVIAWELADKYSFYTDAAKKKDPTSVRMPRPLPYDSELQRKPLWFAMQRAFANAKRA